MNIHDTLDQKMPKPYLVYKKSTLKNISDCYVPLERMSIFRKRKSCHSKNNSTQNLSSSAKSGSSHLKKPKIEYKGSFTQSNLQLKIKNSSAEEDTDIVHSKNSAIRKHRTLIHRFESFDSGNLLTEKKHVPLSEYHDINDCFSNCLKPCSVVLTRWNEDKFIDDEKKTRFHSNLSREVEVIKKNLNYYFETLHSYSKTSDFENEDFKMKTVSSKKCSQSRSSFDSSYETSKINVTHHKMHSSEISAKKLDAKSKSNAISSNNSVTKSKLELNVNNEVNENDSLNTHCSNLCSFSRIEDSANNDNSLCKSKPTFVSSNRSRHNKNNYNLKHCSVVLSRIDCTDYLKETSKGKLKILQDPKISSSNSFNVEKTSLTPKKVHPMHMSTHCKEEKTLTTSKCQKHLPPQKTLHTNRKFSSENEESANRTDNNHQSTISKQSLVIHPNIKESRKQKNEENKSHRHNTSVSSPNKQKCVPSVGSAFHQPDTKTASDNNTSKMSAHRKLNKESKHGNRSEQETNSNSGKNYYIFTSKSGHKYLVDYFECGNIKKMFVHVKLQKGKLDPRDNANSAREQLKKSNKHTVSDVLNSLGVFDKVNQKIFSTNSSYFCESADSTDTNIEDESKSADSSDTNTEDESESGSRIESFPFHDTVFSNKDSPDYYFGSNDENDKLSDNQDEKSAATTNVKGEPRSSFKLDHEDNIVLSDSSLESFDTHSDYNCVHCSQQFFDRNDNYRHTCFGKPIKGFLCVYCEKILPSYQKFKTHKLMHFDAS